MCFLKKFFCVFFFTLYVNYQISIILKTTITYGREAILPIDKTKPLTIHEHMISIMEEIPHIREEARLMIQRAQDHMIQQTPEKERRFIVGEEVLCCDLAKESWYSGKLELKWKGLY